jgi:drug/metabolite transporter (DMT)-like permease
MSAKQASWIHLFLLGLVNLFWAAQYPAYKVASDHVGIATLNLWTFVFAALCLLPFLIKERKHRKTEKRQRLKHDFWRFVLLSVAGILPPSLLLAWGIERSTAANGSILSMTIPVLMTLMGVFMLKEKLTYPRVIGLFLGLAGTLLISTDDLRHASFKPELLAGNLVIFLAGLGSAFYNAYSKELLTRYSELELLVYSDIIGALCCGLISLLLERQSLFGFARYPLSAWISLLILGTLSWGLAMVMWMRVLNQLDLSQISVSVYLLPVFGVALAILTLHEQIQTQQIAGGILVIVGTVALTVFDRTKELEPPEASHSSLPAP